MSRATTVARAFWRRADGAGEDHCRLDRLPDGWLITGHARFLKGRVRTALDYLIRLAPDGSGRSIDIAGRHDGHELGWRMARQEAGWQLNDRPAEHSLGDEEIDLGFTPAAMTAPLMRLGRGGGALPMLDLALPGGATARREDRFTPAGDGRIERDHGGVEPVVIEPHPSGLVTAVEGQWAGRVEMILA